jgi:uncharacterized protein (DUF305 family)
MKTFSHAACIAATIIALTACANTSSTGALPTPTVIQTNASAAMAESGMHHGASTHAPFDAMFIDAMIVHHQGAITMANQALQEASRPEIRALTRAIIEAQQAEIQQMQQWRVAWYPSVPVMEGMMNDDGTMMDMGPMSVSAGDLPFDIRFIDAMVPHHEGAIAMARMALQRATRPEIRQLAEEIISAQSAEIEQMKRWRAEWTN